jgi:RNA polymerase sigma-70 factor (ECF subfamily)
VSARAAAVASDASGMTIPSADDRAWFEREAMSALPELYGAALRLARNRADAEDLAAEAIARAWACLGTLHDRSRFRAWLFRILGNAFISERRSLDARTVVQSLDEGEPDNESFSLFERLHQPFLLWWGNPELAFIDRLLRDDLAKAVDDLPEPFRVVVVMVEVQGLSYQEAADTLGVPVGTIRSRLARGRSLLQKALWAHGVDAGLVRPHDDTEGSR